MHRPVQLHRWFESIIDVTTEDLRMKILGCSAFLYVRTQRATCCALMYGRVESTWKEIAIRQDFPNEAIPYEMLVSARDRHQNDISDEFRKVLLLHKKGIEDMKDGTKKVFQTALNLAANGESIVETFKYKKEPNSKKDGMTRVGEVARAVLNQDWFDLAKLGFEAIIDFISDEPLTYQEFLAAISQYADAKIVQISSEGHLRFVGGECHLNVIEEEKNVKTVIRLYFKNEKNAWIKKELKGNTGFEVFAAETLDGEISNILMEGGRKFPITSPTKG